MVKGNLGVVKAKRKQQVRVVESSASLPEGSAQSTSSVESSTETEVSTAEATPEPKPGGEVKDNSNVQQNSGWTSAAKKDCELRDVKVRAGSRPPDVDDAVADPAVDSGPSDTEESAPEENIEVPADIAKLDMLTAQKEIHRERSAHLNDRQTLNSLEVQLSKLKEDLEREKQVHLQKQKLVSRLEKELKTLSDDYNLKKKSKK